MQFRQGLDIVEVFPARLPGEVEGFIMLKAIDVVAAVLMPIPVRIDASPVGLDISSQLEVAPLAGSVIQENQNMRYCLILSRVSRIGYAGACAQEGCA